MFCIKNDSCLDRESPLYFLPCCGNTICGDCFTGIKLPRGHKSKLGKPCPQCTSYLPQSLDLNIFVNKIRNKERSIKGLEPIDWRTMAEKAFALAESQRQKAATKAEKEAAKMEAKEAERRNRDQLLTRKFLDEPVYNGTTDDDDDEVDNVLQASTPALSIEKMQNDIIRIVLNQTDFDRIQKLHTLMTQLQNTPSDWDKWRDNVLRSASSSSTVSPLNGLSNATFVSLAAPAAQEATFVIQPNLVAPVAQEATFVVEPKAREDVPAQAELSLSLVDEPTLTMSPIAATTSKAMKRASPKAKPQSDDKPADDEEEPPKKRRGRKPKTTISAIVDDEDDGGIEEITFPAVENPIYLAHLDKPIVDDEPEVLEPEPEPEVLEVKPKRGRKPVSFCFG